MGRGLVGSARLGVVVLLLIGGGCASSPFADLPDPRAATDCVEFTKDASGDAGEATDDVLAPGQRPSLDVAAYWFGPTLGPRRAIVATEQEIDHANLDQPELFPIYVVIYQLPADGCQSGLLPGYDPAPSYWGPGREIQVMSEPLEMVQDAHPDRVRALLHTLRPVGG